MSFEAEHVRYVHRDGEVKERSTFGDFVTIRTEESVQDNTFACKTTKHKSHVLRESLSEDRQNVACATLKRMRLWEISISLGTVRYKENNIEQIEGQAKTTMI
jgi:hypothetical protein